MLTTQLYTNVMELPKEYQILNLRMLLNKELYEKEIITFDIFDKMEKLLIKKMNKIILENTKEY